MDTKHIMNTKHSMDSMHNLHTKHLSISNLYISEIPGKSIQLTGT